MEKAKKNPSYPDRKKAGCIIALPLKFCSGVEMRAKVALNVT